MLSRAEALSALESGDGRLQGALQLLVHEGDAKAIHRIAARLEEGPPFEVSRLLELALLASGTPDAMGALVRNSGALRGRNPVLRGVAFADGAPGIPFASNPWGIAQNASVRAALATAWAPVASPAETVLETLLREVLALVLVQLDEGDWALAYLHPWRRPVYELEKDELPPAPAGLFTRRQCLDWADYGSLGQFVGFSPTAGGSQVSAAMGQFCRVHDGMADGLLWISRQDRLKTLRGIYAAFEKPSGSESFTKNNDGRAPDEFVEFFCYGDDAADVFDLGSRDASGDPLVRRWYGQGMDLLDERSTFWEWLTERIPGSFLKLATDE